MSDEEALLKRIRELIEPLGCLATELGPHSVGVQGDARFYGPCVFVTFPSGISSEEISMISTKITNEVPGISRVLANIPT